MQTEEVGCTQTCDGCRIAAQLNALQKEFESTRELVRQVAAAQVKLQLQLENGLVEDNDQWEAIRSLEDSHDVIAEFRDKVIAFHKDMKFHSRIKELEATTNRT